MYDINKSKLNTILKKSNHSIRIDKKSPKVGSKFKIIIEGEIEGENMSNGMPTWFKVWNDLEFQPLKKDVTELKKDMSEVKEDIIELKKGVAAIKNCPTIKRELILK